MDFRDFHDGYFDGIHIESDKTATIFLRSVEKRPYLLILKGVEMFSIAGVKQGNIILDLVGRSAREATLADVRVLYDVGENADIASKLLDNLLGGKKELQILELNPSYGAEGLFLFESAEIKE
jgi:hypothetical protein